MKPKINSDLYPLYFGVVVSRDENVLAKHTDHARIDVKFTDPSIYSIYRSLFSLLKNILLLILMGRKKKNQAIVMVVLVL